MTLLVNVFAGPGAGKSTTTAGVYNELKLRGVNCEMALEYAKDLCWQNTTALLENQIHVFGEQHNRVWRLLGKVDVAISDSPLLNSILYYQGDNAHFKRFIYEEHRRLNNLNILLVREKTFNPLGRVHTEDESKELDGKIKGILDYLGEPYHIIPANRMAAMKIIEIIDTRNGTGK